MRIAICQTKGVAGNVAAALGLMRRTAQAAAARNAGLVIYPEMFLTGYHIGDAVFRLAEPADGPAGAAVARIARETGIAIITGYPERCDDRVYNSACLVNPAGERVANYRKAHLYGSGERRWFQSGDSLLVTEIEGLKVGILICYDVEFPEAVRPLALAGAELIAVPTALIRPFEFVARTLVPARAIENQVFVAYAGLCGDEGDLGYCGLSCIVGPDGKDLARAETDPALLFADIDSSTIREGRKLNPYLSDRRPALYAAHVERTGDPSAKKNLPDPLSKRP